MATARGAARRRRRWAARCRPAGSAGLTVCRTLPPAFAAQVVSVTVAADGTVSLALNSGITVLLGTDTDLPAKYEDVAAIIAHASLHGAHHHRRDRAPVPDGDRLRTVARVGVPPPRCPPGVDCA